MSDYPRTRVTERIPRKDLYDTRLPQVKTQEVPPESNTLRGTTAYVNEARTVVSANIPMYPQITPNDVTQAFGLQFLQEYEPQIYQHYNDILNGVVKSSMGVQKKRDILKKGIKTEEPSPKELAQIYYNRVIGAAIWKYLMYTVKVRVTNKDGESSLQDFDFPLFQYNYPDEKVFETGNPVDKDYSDNGVIAIPLQMTLNPIFYELQTQLQRSQYFEIEDGIIDIDLSGIENDMNASGSINIIYDPAGTNQVCSWDDLMNMQNANFRLQFGIANQQTNFRIVIDNQIGNDGVFQCVRNNAGGQSSAQIVNSAGIIFLLDSKRTQNNQNPALAKVQNYKISRLSDLNLIIPDGFAKLSAKLRTTGQNGDSNLYPILTRLGMGVLAGDFQEGGGSGGDGNQSEDLQDLNRLSQLPTGNSSNINIVSSGSDYYRVGADNSPVLGIGISNWVTQYFSSISADQDIKKKGLNFYNKNLNLSYHLEPSVTSGIAPNYDAHPNDLPLILYGILPPRIDNSDSVSLGTNIFNVIGSAVNGVEYFGYFFESGTQQNISINVGGMPFVGGPNCTLGITSEPLGTTAMGFNDHGSNLYFTKPLSLPDTLRTYLDPSSILITYDSSDTQNINWGKFFTKLVNVAKTVIGAIANRRSTNDITASVSNPMLVKQMANKSLTTAFDSPGAEKNFLLNLIISAGINVTSPVQAPIVTQLIPSKFFSYWINGWNSVDYSEMFSASISFDITPTFVIGRTGENGMGSTNATMTLEVHPHFVASSVDPSTFVTFGDIYKNCLIMDDVDITEHSFDLNCKVYNATATSGTKNIQVASVAVNDTTQNGKSVVLTQNVKTSIQQYYCPSTNKIHVSGSYNFGRPDQLPVEDTITPLAENQPFYMGCLICYSINLQDQLTSVQFNNTNVGYFFFPTSMLTTGNASITIRPEDGNVKVGISSTAGTDNILEIDNLILSLNSIDRKENPSQ